MRRRPARFSRDGAGGTGQSDEVGETEGTAETEVTAETGETGAATAEFTMVAAVLVLLTVTIIQLAVFVHVRNTLIDAASTGARFGALQDRGPEDGVQRTRDLISQSLADEHAEEVSYEYLGDEGERTLRVTVRSQVPVLGIGPGVGSVEVTGSAYEFE
ncbi:TadE family protein [Nesterenkonia aerolata]|uniref:Pilus assembly protein n=1 Tax=Nesterenkonia aerolata TaxID=3074079 RepID=A0ABU2DUN8_9MICC|nr:pilus assembly protein [Nesterenkonia sp. LY-0111]MDR8020208.1 pilus assembly protein [Nesterenkonia sp. LY-0111]